MHQKNSYQFKIKNKIILDPKYPNVFIDKKNPNKIIKIIHNEDEYKLSKLLEHTGFTPKIYDLYIDKSIRKVPKYTRDQQRIRAFNWYYKDFPEKQKELGIVHYENEIKYTHYLIMEKINGNNLLFKHPIENITNNINEIYRIYNILSDKGFILYDLFARNILLSNDGKIYFIDFDPHYIENTLQSIPINKRLSKEKLLASLLQDASNDIK